MQNQNLVDAFLAGVASGPSKTAVFWAEAEHSYESIRRQAAWVRGRLAGLEPGDRVALWMRNRPEFIAALMGILAAGGVAVPVNNFLKPAEVAYLLADSGARVLLAEAAMDGAIDELLAAFPGLEVVRAEDIPSDPPDLPLASPARGRSDLAVLVYTSGTTGRPKGAMLTHGNLLANVESCREVLAVVDFDRFVLMLPMFHSFMLTVCVLLPLSVGGSIVLVKSLHAPKQAVAEILHRRGTVLPAMASLFRVLASLPAEVELPLRLCISGAGPLPGEILRSFNARHSGIPLIEGYGLSEASPVVSVNPIPGPWIAGTIGLPIPGVEVSIQDESGRILPDGEEGEVCVRGANVMAGYWNDPAKTSETLVGGWLRTGDIGKRRTDGHFAITDRKKDMLKPNGVNVYPREIEEVIHGFPGIREAAVVGEPCEKRGERPVAFVSLDDGHAFDERSFHEFLRARLADFKLPRRAIVLPALPRNATGKILKTSLRELLRASA